MKHLVLFLIRLYRYFISPMMHPCCRFYPTCSQYGITAIERFGMVKGLILVLFRVLRCHPWGKSGFDPVPECFNRSSISRSETSTKDSIQKDA